MATQKKYICGFCARAFTRSEHKQRHERSHTNEKPFHCLYCTSAFVRRDLLQRHCRTVHNIKLLLNSQANGIDPGTVIATAANKRKREKEVSPTSPETRHSSVGSNLNLNFSKTANGSLSSSASSSLSSASSTTSTSSPSDLIHLLSITKNLSTLLDARDYQMTNVNDSFLIGYTILLHQPYSLFGSINKDLISFLNSNLTTNSIGNEHSKLFDFKLCLIYAILSVGSCNNFNDFRLDDDESVSNQFLKKSWNILISNLIPNYTSLNYQLEILKNLFVVTYIYLKFNNNHLIVDYLDETVYIILENLISNNQQDIINSTNNSQLFWNIYILLSNIKINSKPPKSFNFFLKNYLPNTQIPLWQSMFNYSKSINFLEDDLINDIIILTLSNELNSIKYNNQLMIYDLNNSLHNAIILINKSIKKNENHHIINDHYDLFKIFKKKMIIGSPVKFKDILNSYVFKISNKYHWNILMISLREYNFQAPDSSNLNLNYNFNFHQLINLNLNTSFANFSNFLFEFFIIPTNTKNNNLINLKSTFSLINNNLGIVSFPLIFQSQFLKFNNMIDSSFNLKKFNLIDKIQLNDLLIEWYLTINKILINLIQYKKQCQLSSIQIDDELIDNNYILQCLLYLLNNQEINSIDINSLDWLLLIINKVNLIFDNWLEFIDHQSYLINFKINLNKFINEYIAIILN
ncbi:hypothetical protein HYPBUDRAFT_93328, partial [Hyphopichia burtonii NRRL Y-1933]